MAILYTEGFDVYGPDSEKIGGDLTKLAPLCLKTRYKARGECSILHPDFRLEIDREPDGKWLLVYTPTDGKTLAMTFDKEPIFTMDWPA